MLLYRSEYLYIIKLCKTIYLLLNKFIKYNIMMYLRPILENSNWIKIKHIPITWIVIQHKYIHKIKLLIHQHKSKKI